MDIVRAVPLDVRGMVMMTIFGIIGGIMKSDLRRYGMVRLQSRVSFTVDGEIKYKSAR